MTDLRLNTTLSDGVNRVSLIDEIAVTRPVGLGTTQMNVSLRGIEAGPGIQVDLVDADGVNITTGQKIRITALGNGGGGAPVTYSSLPDRPLVNTTVDGEPCLALSQSLDLNGKKLVNGIGGGAIDLNGTLYERKQTVNIDNNQTTPTTLYTLPYAGKLALYVDYLIDRGVAGMRSGTLLGITDGTSVSLVDNGVEALDSLVGVNFTAIIVGGHVQIQYTSNDKARGGSVLMSPRVIR